MLFCKRDCDLAVPTPVVMTMYIWDEDSYVYAYANMSYDGSCYKQPGSVSIQGWSIHDSPISGFDAKSTGAAHVQGT